MGGCSAVANCRSPTPSHKTRLRQFDARSRAFATRPLRAMEHARAIPSVTHAVRRAGHGPADAIQLSVVMMDARATPSANCASLLNGRRFRCLMPLLETPQRPGTTLDQSSIPRSATTCVGTCIRIADSLSGRRGKQNVRSSAGTANLTVPRCASHRPSAFCLRSIDASGSRTNAFPDVMRTAASATVVEAPLTRPAYQGAVIRANAACSWDATGALATMPRASVAVELHELPRPSKTRWTVATTVFDCLVQRGLRGELVGPFEAAPGNEASPVRRTIGKTQLTAA